MNLTGEQVNVLHHAIASVDSKANGDILAELAAIVAASYAAAHLADIEARIPLAEDDLRQAEQEIKRAEKAIEAAEKAHKQAEATAQDMNQKSTPVREQWDIKNAANEARAAAQTARADLNWANNEHQQAKNRLSTLKADLLKLAGRPQPVTPALDLVWRYMAGKGKK